MNPDHYHRHGSSGRYEYDDGPMYEPYGGNRYDDDRGGGRQQEQGNSLPSLLLSAPHRNYHHRHHQQEHHHHHQPSALEGCMCSDEERRLQQQNDRCYSTIDNTNDDNEEDDRKPGAFHDTTAYDDILERKRAAYAPPTPRARNAANDTMIELGPGVHARLRGASETWACIEVDFHVPVTCCACDLELCCIQDADYVLCPRCKVVSPLEGAVPSDTYFARNDDSGGGVGLGFTFDELFKWQAEIMNRRNQQQRLQNNMRQT